MLLRWFKTQYKLFWIAFELRKTFTYEETISIIEQHMERDPDWPNV